MRPAEGFGKRLPVRARRRIAPGPASRAVASERPKQFAGCSSLLDRSTVESIPDTASTRAVSDLANHTFTAKSVSMAYAPEDLSILPLFARNRARNPTEPGAGGTRKTGR